MSKGYDKFDANMNTLNHVYQIMQEANDFDFIITEINVSEFILYQMKKLPGETYLFIVIHGKIQQTVASVFMLPYDFNTIASLFDNNFTFLFY